MGSKERLNATWNCGRFLLILFTFSHTRQQDYAMYWIDQDETWDIEWGFCHNWLYLLVNSYCKIHFLDHNSTWICLKIGYPNFKWLFITFPIKIATLWVYHIFTRAHGIFLATS